MAKEISIIRQEAQQVHNATQVGENTAQRVGGVLVDIVDKAEEHETDIDNLNANTGVADYPVFSASTAYSAGVVVNYNGKLYKFTADHEAGAWNSGEVTETSLKKKMDEKITELELKNRNICFYSYNSVSPYIFKSPFKSIRFFGVDMSKSYYLRQFQYNYNSNGVFIQIYSEDGTKTYNFTKGISESTRVGSIKSGNATVFFELYEDVADNYSMYNGNNSPYTNIFSTDVFFSNEDIVNINNEIEEINNSITKIEEDLSKNDSNIQELADLIDGGKTSIEYTINKENSTNQFIDDYGGLNGNIGLTNFWTTKPIAIENATEIKLSNVKLGTNWLALAFYEEAGRIFISGYKIVAESTTEEEAIVEIPENAKYMRLCQTVDMFDSFKCTVITNQDNGIVQEIQNIKSEITKLNEKPLAGKEVLMFGDSFIDYGIYPAAIESLLGCTVINRGVGGSTICRRTDKPNQSLICRLKEEEGAITTGKGGALPESCDLVIIHAGVNDFIQWKGLGSIDLGLSDDTKIYSAIQIILYNLIEKYPGVPIIWGTPCHFKSNTSENKDLYYEESNRLVQVKNSCTLEQIRNAIIECCALFGVKVADFYAESNIYPLIESNNTLYTEDGLHPNEAGANKLAEIINKCL